MKEQCLLQAQAQAQSVCENSTVCVLFDLQSASSYDKQATFETVSEKYSYCQLRPFLSDIELIQTTAAAPMRLAFD